MGTRADFYIKEKKDNDLIWIASIAWDGYPDGIDDYVLKSKTKRDFLKNLSKFLSSRDDVTKPEQGWPWPWDNSNTTDYAYCFNGEKVLANSFGDGWYNPKSKKENPLIIWHHPFPDMSKVKNVRYDKGSGLLIISANG